MVLNDEARELLIDKGFNPDYGARPLRRALEHDIEDPLAEELLRGTFEDKNMIRVTVEEGKLAFEADMVEESEDAEAEAEPAAASA
jgi:ATP-dependent Clp protease ATP-binding subunit ClpC